VVESDTATAHSNDNEESPAGTGAVSATVSSATKQPAATTPSAAAAAGASDAPVSFGPTAPMRKSIVTPLPPITFSAAHEPAATTPHATSGLGGTGLLGSSVPSSRSKYTF
jgi:hypothetical protein